MKLTIFTTFTLAWCTFTVSATNYLNNPEDWSPVADSACYTCGEFSTAGQGFVAYPNTTMCCMYYECWRTVGAQKLLGSLRRCPRGTWFNNDIASNGAPCVNNKPYEECIDVCEYAYPEYKPSDCHYVVNPDDPDEREQFGLIDGDGEWQLAGSCRTGFVWDEGSCTCSPSDGDPCACLADFPLVGDAVDRSCTKSSAVECTGDLKFPTDPELGKVAEFTGAEGKNHLTSSVFSGLYAGCWVKKLSAGVFFKATNVVSLALQGLISYGSCLDQTEPKRSSYGLYLRAGFVVAGMGDYEATYGPINADQWYYTAFTYKRRAKKDNLKLFVMTMAEYDTCVEDKKQCVPKDMVTTNKACIESRQCGLTIGFTGSSDDPEEFFHGRMSKVQVFHGDNVMLCDS